MAADTLHAGLAEALALNTPGRGQHAGEHVVVALPSFSLGATLLTHYADRLPALEHRYLLSALMLGRIPSSELVFVCSRAPDPALVEHYIALTGDPGSRDRLHIVNVADESARPIAAKLLDRADLVAAIRALVGGRPAFLEPWNVTELEVDVADALGIPANGTSPDLWHLGFKSAGRRLFERVGVPVPLGVADVRGATSVANAVARMRRRQPSLPGIVIKHDDSGAGDGNTVIRLIRPDGTTLGRHAVQGAIAALPEWYRADLHLGAVVEELVSGAGVSSPSVQLDVTPDGEVRVLSTHEQVLGGADAQVYLGCRFPADPQYAGQLAGQAEAVGVELARLGARGRLGIDFMARPVRGGYETLALELNLRKGGTTHPFCALRNLVPGHYDAEQGRWVAEDGSTRYYSATDNLQHDGWVGLPVPQVLESLAEEGLTFDPPRGTGVVVHMPACLAIDGRIGVIAISTSREGAAALVGETERAIHRLRLGVPSI